MLFFEEAQGRHQRVGCFQGQENPRGRMLLIAVAWKHHRHEVRDIVNLAYPTMPEIDLGRFGHFPPPSMAPCLPKSSAPVNPPHAISCRSA